MSVFIGVEDPTGRTNIFPARNYQVSAYNTFMSNQYIEKIEFRYPGGIIFNIQKFNQPGLKGDYTRFCTLVNDKGEEHILSDDEHLLNGYVGFKNRMTVGGIEKKKKSRKKV